MSDANAEYQRRKVEVHSAIIRLQDALNEHVKRQTEKPTFWTFPADLAKVRRDLLEAAAFLGDYDAREELQFLSKGGESR